MGFDPISYILAKRASKPTLKDIIINTDKDWQGYRIMNLGEPTDPNDATRKIYVDKAVTGLGINYYLLDAADSEVPAYKQLSLTPPELSETYVEISQNSTGDYLIASWIAPADGVPVLRLGVYTLHFQAERISGNIDVRFFFRLYERDTGGNETLIAESSLSDLVTDRRDVVVSLILASDYEMAEGSRLVVKVYARYLSGGSSTTMRLYYQGDVRSRLATPTAKEILDNIYASITHTHDASDINSGVLSIDRIPNTVLNFYSVGRDVETTYQNPYSDKYLLEIVTVKVQNGDPNEGHHGIVKALIGSSSPPSTVVAQAEHYLPPLEYYVTTLVFIVPPGYYYKIYKSSALVSIVSWFEAVLK